MGGGMKEYGDSHRMFAQAMLSRGIVNGLEITNLFKICCQKGELEIDDPAQDKKDFLLCVNSRLSKLNLKLKNIADEVDTDKKSFLALVNLTDRSNETSKLTIKAMNTFAPFEIEYLKLIIEAIIYEPGKQVGLTMALNACSSVKTKKLGVVDAQRILDKLHQNKWLIINRDKLRFHPRFIAEMEPWLKDMYPDFVNTCTACQKLVIKSLYCPNEDCEGVYHIHCIYDRKVKNRGKCLRCKGAMDMKRVGDKDDTRATQGPTQSSQSSQPSQSSGAKTGAKRKRSRIVQNDSDSDN